MKVHTCHTGRVVFMLLSLLVAIMCVAQQPVQMASLHPRTQLAWQRVWPAGEADVSTMEGPVLYTIIMRSNAAANHIPKISDTYTLTNSLISDDNTNVYIGGLAINGSSGIISFANNQAFPGAGTVTSVSNGDGFVSITSPATTPVINLNTTNTDARYVKKAGDTMIGALLVPGLEIHKDAAGALGPVLSLTNGGGFAGAAAAINFGTTAANIPGSQIEAVDDGNSSNNVVISTKAPGNLANPLQSRLTVQSIGDVQVNSGNLLMSSGNLIVDASGNSSNADISSNALLFGGLTSVEGMASERVNGDNRFGLDFYTAGMRRMYITNSGDVHVPGNLTKGAGSFKIDHPLDPANKYLYHSFVESPDMKNIYDGTIITDKRGNATVVLPEYFTALNRDYRYQLTVIGQFAQAIVATEIQNNRFTIKTSKPLVKVSWQVTGIRQDAYANAHRIPVEEEKTGAEKGAYLHPELFGQPQGKGMAQVEHPR